MKNIKDYREKELKNYVISNILLVTLLSGTFNAVLSIVLRKFLQTS